MVELLAHEGEVFDDAFGCVGGGVVVVGVEVGALGKDCRGES